MTGTEKSCCFWGNCMLFKRKRRGRDGERQRRVMTGRRRNKDSEWKYNRGRKRKWQNAEHAASGHTEPTCMLPTVLYMEPRGKITPYVKHMTRPRQWCHQYESCCVVTVITDDGWPHMSLISSWHRKTQFLQGTSANQDGGKQRYSHAFRNTPNLSAVVVLTQKVPVTPP